VPCPRADDEEIEEALAQWRRHREMAVALAKKAWANRADRIRADVLASPDEAKLAALVDVIEAYEAWKRR
jgi:hypothetical protein